MACIKETSTNGQSGPDGIHDQEFDWKYFMVGASNIWDMSYGIYNKWR